MFASGKKVNHSIRVNIRGGTSWMVHLENQQQQLETTSLILFFLTK